MTQREINAKIERLIDEIEWAIDNGYYEAARRLSTQLAMIDVAYPL